MWIIYNIIYLYLADQNTMYRHMGHHFVKKYNHTLVVDTVYQDLKPQRASQVLTSESSRPSRDKSWKINPEQQKKRSRTYLFSPQISLRIYKSKAKRENSQNSKKKSEEEVKLIISAMPQNSMINTAHQARTVENHREVSVCSHCQNRQAWKNTRESTYLKMLSQQQNSNCSNLLQRIAEIKATQFPKLESSKNIFVVAHRIKTRRPSPKSNTKAPCIHTSSEFKPWDMNASESSF